MQPDVNALVSNAKPAERRCLFGALCPQALGARLQAPSDAGLAPAAAGGAVAPGGKRRASAARAVRLCSVTRRLLSSSVEKILATPGAAAQQQHEAAAADGSDSEGTRASASASTSSGDEAAPEAGRVVLLVGPVAQQGLGATLNDDLVEWGVAPALIAGYHEDT